MDGSTVLTKEAKASSSKYGRGGSLFSRRSISWKPRLGARTAPADLQKLRGINAILMGPSTTPSLRSSEPYARCPSKLRYGKKST